MDILELDWIMRRKRSKLKEESFEFALWVIHLYQQMIKDREFVMSKQILRSGTSVGANIREAQNTQSRQDFFKSRKYVKDASSAILTTKQNSVAKLITQNP